jgi:hypothetical protein
MNNKNQHLENQFCTKEQSVRVKNLGFNGLCLYGFSTHYENSKLCKDKWKGCDYNRSANSETIVSIPTRSQVFTFFREKFKLYHHIRENHYKMFEYEITPRQTMTNKAVASYEEAEFICIDNLILIAQNINK